MKSTDRSSQNAGVRELSLSTEEFSMSLITIMYASMLCAKLFATFSLFICRMFWALAPLQGCRCL